MTDNFIADAVPANIAVLHKSWPFITDFNEFTGAHRVPSIPGSLMVSFSPGGTWVNFTKMMRL